ncbi:MAG: membrane protein insertion efficiency factor YidD [Candidatus Pelagibacter sp. TMED165]|nr:MAG: membrane protein insertion efficiency factor YidD [Candidatus Pelagibacter sp. TMED165]
MSKFIIFLLIFIIKIYKYFISPIFPGKCRYLPTCSEYFIESLNVHGIIKGIFYGSKRIFSCHPIKFLGGGSGLDLVPKKVKKGKV